MDLQQLKTTGAADEGAVLELRHPVTDEVLTHDGEPMTITLLGEDSKALRKKRRGVHRQKANQLVKRQNADITTTEEEDLDFVATATVAWHLFIGGEWLELSYEAAVQVYREYPWIYEQANVFIGDRAHFLPTS